MKKKNNDIDFIFNNEGLKFYYCKGITLKGLRCRMLLPEGVDYCDHHVNKNTSKIETKEVFTPEVNICKGFNYKGDPCVSKIPPGVDFCARHIPPSNKVCPAVTLQGELCGSSFFSSRRYCNLHKDYLPRFTNKGLILFSEEELNSRLEALPEVFDYVPKTVFKDDFEFLSLKSDNDRSLYLKSIEDIAIDRYNGVLCSMRNCSGRPGVGYIYCYKHREQNYVGKYIKTYTPKKCLGVTVNGLPCKNTIGSDNANKYCFLHERDFPKSSANTDLGNVVPLTVMTPTTKKKCLGLTAKGVGCNNTIGASNISNYCSKHKNQFKPEVV
jgi:hypothetical protein